MEGVPGSNRLGRLGNAPRRLTAPPECKTTLATSVLGQRVAKTRAVVVFSADEATFFIIARARVSDGDDRSRLESSFPVRLLLLLLLLLALVPDSLGEVPAHGVHRVQDARALADAHGLEPSRSAAGGGHGACGDGFGGHASRRSGERKVHAYGFFETPDVTHRLVAHAARGVHDPQSRRFWNAHV
jgi:hypothetical protein